MFIAHNIFFLRRSPSAFGSLSFNIRLTHPKINTRLLNHFNLASWFGAVKTLKVVTYVTKISYLRCQNLKGSLIEEALWCKMYSKFQSFLCRWGQRKTGLRCGKSFKHWQLHNGKGDLWGTSCNGTNMLLQWWGPV